MRFGLAQGYPISAVLGHFAIGNQLGEALMETLLRLPLPADRNRRPDLAFVSARPSTAHVKSLAATRSLQNQSCLVEEVD